VCADNGPAEGPIPLTFGLVGPGAQRQQSEREQPGEHVTVTLCRGLVHRPVVMVPVELAGEPMRLEVSVAKSSKIAAARRVPRRRRGTQVPEP